MQEKEIIDQGMVLNIINKLPVFDRFTAEEKIVLVKHRHHFAVYKKDEELIREADTDSSFFVLIAGSVRVSKKNVSIDMATLKPGDTFGEISFLTPVPRTASVIAREDDVLVMKMDKELLEQLAINIREKIKDKIIEKLIERLEHMNSTIASLSC